MWARYLKCRGAGKAPVRGRIFLPTTEMNITLRGTLQTFAHIRFSSCLILHLHINLRVPESYDPPRQRRQKLSVSNNKIHLRSCDVGPPLRLRDSSGGTSTNDGKPRSSLTHLWDLSSKTRCATPPRRVCEVLSHSMLLSTCQGRVCSH